MRTHEFRRGPSIKPKVVPKFSRTLQLGCVDCDFICLFRGVRVYSDVPRPHHNKKHVIVNYLKKKLIVSFILTKFCRKLNATAWVISTTPRSQINHQRHLEWTTGHIATISDNSTTFSFCRNHNATAKICSDTIHT